MIFAMVGSLLISLPLAQGQAAPVPSAPAAPAAPAARFVVVLDAAHGGDDTGAHLKNGALEKNVTLAMSARLRSLLNARGIFVVTTRETDVAIDINRRAEIANHVGAQACISLHATASGGGIHLFTSSLAPTGRSRMAPWKTAQSGWSTQSLALAGAVNSTLQQAGFVVSLARTNLPGIDSMTCPAIALEFAQPLGADHQPEGTLTDTDFQTHMTEALAAALLEWRAEVRQQ